MDANRGACICCLSDKIGAFYAGLLRCGKCGHVFADLDLSDDQLRGLYSHRYFKGYEYHDYELEEAALSRNFRDRLKVLAQHLPKGSSLLEIGCAYGYFLREAEYHFSSVGCDISEDAVRFAREHVGVRAVCTDFLKWECNEVFDIICMWDTIEHLRAPHLYVERAALCLRPGGTLILSTGDIGSFMARWRGPKWRLIHPPTHLHYFSKSSITCLLERVGFRDIVIEHGSVWRSSRAIANRLLPYWTYKVLDRCGLLRLNVSLNFYDIMTVRGTRCESPPL